MGEEGSTNHITIYLTQANLIATIYSGYIIYLDAIVEIETSDFVFFSLYVCA